MVNVTKINKLFPTFVHEFQYIADDNLTKAIKNEDLETKIINHTSSSVDNNLQKMPNNDNFDFIIFYIFITKGDLFISTLK